MPESITESEKDHNEGTVKNKELFLHDGQHDEMLLDRLAARAQPLIIWTPRFIVIFALVLVVGLSTASLLTQGWLNGYYEAPWAELGYDSVAFCCWIAVIFFARSEWIRLGAIFGVIWTIFMGANFITLMLIPLDHNSILIGYINGASNIALLGSFICISIANTPFRRWDMWFFRLAPIIGIAAVVVAHFHAPAEFRTLSQLENHTTNIALYLCMAVWWLRPSCWKAQPGLTFLLGMNPVIQRLLGFQFPHNGEPILFYTQVILLLFILAAMRIIQYERVTRPVLMHRRRL